VTLRILSLAEADVLDGFRFYERQGSGVGWYFLESPNSDMSHFALRAFTEVFGYHRMLSNRFRSPSL
jgi:hypothetical protein